MLANEVRESQVAIELPAREMMQSLVLNGSLVTVNQLNANFQLGLINVNAGQANAAVVTVTQTGAAAS